MAAFTLMMLTVKQAVGDFIVCKF